MTTLRPHVWPHPPADRLLLLLGMAIAVVLVAVLLNEVAAPFPDPGRLPPPRPAGS